MFKAGIASVQVTQKPTSLKVCWSSKAEFLSWISFDKCDLGFAVWLGREVYFEPYLRRRAEKVR